jgi:hypothetical protein
MGAIIRHSGWGYTPLPRFFRKDKMVFTPTIHDYMHIVDDARSYRLELTDQNCIAHFNYIDSIHFVEKLNRYTSIEAQHLFDSNIAFSYYHLFKNSCREFYLRFLVGKGFKDGVRGFSLALMMAFYRALTYIKLWEKSEYKTDPVSDRYNRVRQTLCDEWKNYKK